MAIIFISSRSAPNCRARGASKLCDIANAADISICSQKGKESGGEGGRELESVLEGVKGNEQQVKIEIYDVEGHSPANRCATSFHHIYRFLMLPHATKTVWLRLQAMLLRLLRLLLLLFTLSMMQEFVGVKLLYEDQCTITKRRHHTCGCICVSVCVCHCAAFEVCHAPLLLPLQL